MSYADLDRARLEELEGALKREYAEHRAKGLSLNMARGKPSPAQLALSLPLLDTVCAASQLLSRDGVDCRNYGTMDGIAEAKELMGQIMGHDRARVCVFGNSSLNIMFDLVTQGMMHGYQGAAPWRGLDRVKWLCPVPGYDRHFAITESYGIEMIPVPTDEHGPDMDEVERLVAEDDAVKGIWCVPQYSNPSGAVYSDETVYRLASMPCAAPDFRIFWDNAYCVHALYDESDELLNIFDVAREAGTEDRVIAFASTSKITFPGAGIGFVAASPRVIGELARHLKAGLISADKMNQLRHARFLPTMDAVREHMRKHAEHLRPRFELVEKKLREGLDGTGCAAWTHPRGGYFVSFDGPAGSARRVGALCAELGVTLTPAGATWPGGHDPQDTNIRIAPSYPSVEELGQALEVLVLAVKLVSARLAQEERAA